MDAHRERNDPVGAAGSHLQVFLSYRREDSEAWTGRIYEVLAQRVGADSVFMDIDDIPLGQDFVDVLQERLRGCHAMLAIIGPLWATIADENGTPRLDDPDDFVRLEIEEGLSRKIPLIPVLVGGAALPRRDQLPDSCVPLARRMAVRITHETFRGDVERVIRALEKIAQAAAPIGSPPPERAVPDAAQDQSSVAGVAADQDDLDEALAQTAAAVSEESAPVADASGVAEAVLQQGRGLENRGDPRGAEAAYKRADELGDAEGAYFLGRMFERRRAMREAAAAYRRADERGSAAGANHLGLLLRDRDDLDGAEAAYRRADERGSAAGSQNLGGALERRGDLAGAEAAYRRADERGSAGGSRSLAWILERRGDLAGAQAAFGRADERDAADATRRRPDSP